MTTSSAAFPLLPGRHTPVIASSLVVSGYTGPVAAYGDMVWPLDPLSANPSADRKKLYWDRFPAGHRQEFRLLAWTMINNPLPDWFLVGRPAWHSRLSATTLHSAVLHWRNFATWLHSRGTAGLGACAEAVFGAYARHVAARPGASRAIVTTTLSALTRLWAFDALSPAPLGLATPPWVRNGVDDYLPAQTSRGENATEPITPATMGPLLVWALRMVDDFSDDILTAWAESRHLTARADANAATPRSKARLKHYLEDLTTRGAPVPSRQMFGRTMISARYIAAETGCSTSQINALAMTERWRDLGEYVRNHPGPCPLTTPVTGRIEGERWTPAVDYTEIRTLMRHLGTACFIVIAYLTGMRPGEVMGLSTGCCPEVPSGQHVIQGRVFKGSSDEEGNHHSAGTLRDVPWVAIAPVVAAVRVLEKIVPDNGLLFDAAAHTFQTPRPSDGTSLGYEALRARIEDFVTWTGHQALRLGRPHETIPDDRHGAIGVARFRRSLAWHIARRPGGLVALAIQYGHLRTAVSAGYASRSRDGIHELLDLETARATADTLTTLHQDLAAGTGISGPAARRAIQAAAHAPYFAGSLRTARQARDILDNPALAVYDNPNALLMCVYNPQRALCHRTDTTDSPRLDRCQPSCANIARTDRHAQELRQRAAALERQALSEAVPGPLAERLHHNCARLRAQANAHIRDRVTRESTL
ncbi:integrase [Streptomyces virginiae]|uniref:integrase n=1 Tax=Streptomyces virginiae TaxID=1961 RepID=UPI003710F4C8